VIARQRQPLAAPNVPLRPLIVDPPSSRPSPPDGYGTV